MLFRIFWIVEYHEIFLLSGHISNENIVSGLSKIPMESHLLTNGMM